MLGSLQSSSRVDTAGFQTIKRGLMKTLLFAMLVFTVLSVSGQSTDFQTIQPESVACFQNEPGYIYCIRIDSVDISNGQILYPFTVNQPLANRFYSPEIASWIGSRIVIRDNGINVFINYRGDSIMINTRALIDDEWIAWHKPDDMQVVARVTNLAEMEFLGLKDTVKTIEFQCYDKDLNPQEYNINGMEIKISKSFGLIKAINLYYFPDIEYPGFSPYHPPEEMNLVGLSRPEVGIQNLTWFDVYDFQPGDEIHVFKQVGDWIGMWDGYFDITETKYIYTYMERENYPDSIRYTYSLAKEVLHKSTGKTTLDTDTLSVLIAANPSFDKLPLEPVNSPVGFPQDDNTYIYYEMKADHHISKWRHNYWFEKYDEDSWIELHYDGVPTSTYYIKGLGGPFYPYSAEFGSMLHQEPVFYKKGEETWGNPLVLNADQKIESRNHIRIFPNPVRNNLTISIAEFQSPALTFTLFDLNGRVMQTVLLEYGDNLMNMTALNPGIYFYRITDQERIIKIDKIVVQ
jgi:hypothetical protein